MQALILAGGKGTRLRPLTLYTPKPIVPLVNKPFLLYQIEILARAGIRDINLSLGYQPDKIEDVLGDGSRYGVRLRFLTEPNPLGTAGAYRFAADSTAGPTVVLNGDIFTDADVAAIVEFHRQKQAVATITLVSVDDPSSFGLVETDADARVVRFLEKPKPEDVAALNLDTINAGIYVLEPSVLDLIERHSNASFEYDVFPAILDRGLDFFAFVLRDSYWKDIGTPATYLAAHLDLLDGRVGIFERSTSGRCDIATAAAVDAASVLGEGCTIKPQARVVRSVLGPGVTLEEKALVENSVIWAHTRIGAGAEVSGAVIGRGSHIGRQAVARPGTVLGDKASIPDYSKI